MVNIIQALRGQRAVKAQALADARAKEAAAKAAAKKAKLNLAITLYKALAK